MTEPNIVYIGDEVRVIEDDYVKDRVFWVVGGERRRVPESLALPVVDQLWITMHDGWHVPVYEVTTPDGRPVEGFGGAQIERGHENAGDVWTVRGVHVAVVGVDRALQQVCELYGEWVREPTESDLRRRGLL